jgi:small subunit ribosomal protein S1
MPKQKLTYLKDETDPFSTTTVEVDLPKGTKILSQNSNVLELLKFYEGVEIKEPPVDDEIRSLEVISIDKYDNVILSLDGKQDAYMNRTKEKGLEDLKIGDYLKVKLKVKKDGGFEASFSDAIAKQKIDEIVDSIGKNVGYRAKVSQLIHGGYFVEIDGIKCFMPGSLAGMNKLVDFSTLLHQEIIVVPVNYSEEREIPVVSHRDYLKTMIPGKIKDVGENLDEWRTGFVTGTSGAGVFVEFEQCLTGLIPIAEIEKSEEAYKNGFIKPGDKISFRIKQIISDTKILLTEKEKEASPWDNIQDRFSPEQLVVGRVSKTTNYGVFVEIEKGISGLMHSSQLPKDSSFKEGDDVEVIISKIEQASRKIVLRKA